jgi:hypothetical protein
MDQAMLLAQQGYLLAIEIEMQGMIAENLHRTQCGESLAYTEKAFNELRDQAAIIADSIITSRRS